ncbi:MAG: hypothetical protein JNM22_01945 [Saprospiraceae bacterium]|nr:hypothetical protein [Saprospiraceae bacterium]
MKSILCRTIASLCILIMLQCSTKTEKPALPVLNCSATIKPLVFEGNNYYYLVTGFDSKQSDCYKAIRRYITEVSPNLTAPYTMHFLDNLPDFKPVAGKMYGNEAIRKKVIAQYMYFKGSKEDVMFDPVGEGIYVEPGN